MCGITGFIDLARSTSREALNQTAARMADRILHRGPDDGGVWVDETSGVALAHRRLSILDLSPLGAQPMVSASGRYVVVYNGEIYNFPMLKAQLSYPWKGHSDTEVLLAAVEAWGVLRTLESIHGMFAFALLDREEKKLYLARDRMGEKPLYFARMAGAFLFGSELKALRAHPAFEANIDRSALSMMMRYNHIPSSHCIYENVQKLLPGTFLTLDVTSGELKHEQYWSTEAVAQKGMRSPLKTSPEETSAQLEALLTETVRRMIVSDVPLGAFLSGGVDSSLVVALMQQASSRPVKTFTMGFEDARYNEAPHAKAVAQHLGTEHTEMIVTEAETLGVIPLLPGIYDEPFADSSQIPTYLVSKLAREHVTVALSGDGGDELFAGYNRHVAGPSIYSKFGGLPVSAQKMMKHFILSIPPEKLDRIFGAVMHLLPARYRASLPGEKLHKVAGLLPVQDLMTLYRFLTSSWQDAASLVIGGSSGYAATPPALGSPLQSMMLWDQLGYLPGDILTKVDRASMAVSLEGRVPLLDPQVVEFAWRISASQLIAHGKGKAPLRGILYRHVPRALIERPKMGFGVPIAAWLREGLKDWGEELLSESRLTQEGFLNAGPIRKAWAEHQAGTHNRQHELWNVLMFQAWLEKNKA